MELILAVFLILLTMSIIFGSTSAVKIINEGNEAIVERFHRYNRTLKPGIHLVIPLVEKIVFQDTLREIILEIKPQHFITNDNVYVEIESIAYWRIFNIERAYYDIPDIEETLGTAILTMLRPVINQKKLAEILADTDKINKELLKILDPVTSNWGIKVLRVEFRNIKPPPGILESIKQARLADIKKQAEILAAESTVKSLELISKALMNQPNGKEVLQYLLAQKYLEATQKLGESPNAKILFMDPKMWSETLDSLIHSIPKETPEPPSNPPPNPESK